MSNYSIDDMVDLAFNEKKNNFPSTLSEEGFKDLKNKSKCFDKKISILEKAILSILNDINESLTDSKGQIYSSEVSNKVKDRKKEIIRANPTLNENIKKLMKSLDTTS